VSIFKTRITELFGIEYPIIQDGMTAMNTGDIEEGILPLGMVSGRIQDIKPVKKIIDDIVDEADQLLNTLAERKYWKA
jgi:NAD(P)H-dependent flavin oxidoreductase YrpB (nitropropane dioxygenase family)